MSNENLLCDLESDIDGSWDDIQASVMKKERKQKTEKEIENLKNNPLRMKFPHFASFYKMMLMLYRSYRESGDDLPYEVERMMESMFYRAGDGEKMSPAFDYVWAMFCDPSKYAFTMLECKYCDKKWDIVIKREKLYREFPSNGDRIYNETRTFYRAFCPICNNAIGMMQSKFIGIFKHQELKETDMNDIESYRNFLEERGYDIR